MVPRPYADVPGLLVDVSSGDEWMTPNDGRFRRCVVQNGTESLIRLSLTFVPESGALHIFVEAPRSAKKALRPPRQAPRKKQRGARAAAAQTTARVQKRQRVQP